MEQHRLKLTMREIRIPFKVSFKHSSAERSQTQSVIVEARNQKGDVGYGESCPREYVTGETIHSVFQFFKEHQSEIEATLGDLDALRYWLALHEHKVNRNPSAWCAIEIALLDLFSVEQNISVETLLGLPQLANRYQYTAILGDNDETGFIKHIQQYAAMKFTDYKLKLSGDIEKDQKKLKLLDCYGGDFDRVRVDANNLWENEDDVVNYIRELKYPLFAIEEPLRSKDIAELSELGRRLCLPIILDESFSIMSEMTLFTGAPTERWILNLRISKMGGILRSLAIAQRAVEMNIPIIIGAQVGETSILTRAALTVTTLAKNALIAQEGAFSTLLLEEDICSPSLMFGKSGILDIRDFQLGSRRGFGLTINHVDPNSSAFP